MPGMAKQKKMKIFCAAGRSVLPKDGGNISSTGFVGALCAQGAVAAEGPAERACGAG